MTGSAMIVGTGLLGTSVGLAASRAGWSVWLKDSDERAARLAESLGAGERGQPPADPDVVVVAVPPGDVGKVTHQLSQLFLTSTFTDVCSVKAEVQLDVERFGPAGRFVGGHPMAGRERSGPEGASADLFRGQPWVLCPTPGTNEDRLKIVRSLVLACGGQPVVMNPQAHDEAVARISHAPQVVASALAAQLLAATPGELELAGQGLRDTARIAASDPTLWVEVLTANAAPVAEVLQGVIAELATVTKALHEIAHSGITGDGLSVDRFSNRATRDPRDEVQALLAQGQRGISRVAGKHGAAPVNYAVVPVVIPDEPGALARLLVAAGEAGINVEDLAIEHSPGQPVGLVELFVLPDQVSALSESLSAQGWSVH